MKEKRRLRRLRCMASYTQNITQGQKYDSRINAVYSGCVWGDHV